MRSRLRSSTEGIVAGSHDTGTRSPSNEAAPGKHFATQRAAHGQSFGHSGTGGLCPGQHSIGPAVEDTPAMSTSLIVIGLASAIEAAAAAASARADGVTIGAQRNAIAAKTDSTRVMRIEVFTPHF